MVLLSNLEKKSRSQKLVIGLIPRVEICVKNKALYLKPRLIPLRNKLRFKFIPFYQEHLMRIVTLFMLSIQLLSASDGLNLKYEVDLTKFESDSFYVKLDVTGIKDESALFQFAATAPGTYQVMDVGRFVGGFQAWDSKGGQLPVEQASINQYKISDAKKLARITYRVDDTQGNPMKENLIYPMCGSNLEKDNVILNGQMVYGYFKNFQSNPIDVKFIYPKEWSVGTALTEKKGVYTAENYDHIVDSPVMFGRLTHAQTKVGGADIHVYSYSKNDIVTADSLLGQMKTMLEAAEKFLGKLPVKRYAFLFNWRTDLPGAYGAWEHSYSSLYAMPEQPLSVAGPQAVSFAAHEFFHIVTPLNIHSEIVGAFNFEKPIASEHLWLYEATTEWAAQMMQIRGGMISEAEFIDRIEQKLKVSDFFSPRVSLVDLSKGSFDSLADQYINIYQRGAYTMMLFDMRLLELSKGKMGWNDVIKKLASEYGPKKSFPEKEFFDIVVKMTYPEMIDFFARYIKGSEKVPMKEYLAKVGYNYVEETETGKFKGSAGSFQAGFNDGKVVVGKVTENDSINMVTGLQVGDALIKLSYHDKTVSFFDHSMRGFIDEMQWGDDFTLTVLRGGQEMDLHGKSGRKPITVKHQITPMETLTAEQKEFRKMWLTNN